MPIEVTLSQLNRLVGDWTLEAIHPAMPGVVVQGSCEIRWLEGERFLIHRATLDHRDFPDSISILGSMERDRADTAREQASKGGGSAFCMHYFDSRGVFRVYDASMDDTVWRLWRDSPGFSQRFAGKLSADGNSVAGQWEASQDGKTWENDLKITYARRR